MVVCGWRDGPGDLVFRKTSALLAPRSLWESGRLLRFHGLPLLKAVRVLVFSKQNADDVSIRGVGTSGDNVRVNPQDVASSDIVSAQHKSSQETRVMDVGHRKLRKYPITTSLSHAFLAKPSRSQSHAKAHV